MEIEQKLVNAYVNRLAETTHALVMAQVKLEEVTAELAALKAKGGESE